MKGDMTGRVCLITGANTGIGLATALALAHRGAEVYLTCRTEAAAEPVVASLVAATGNEAVHAVPLDLGSFDSVHAAAERFLTLDRPLHVLIHNAGVAGQRGLTASGFELHFGVNHLGHFLLTHLLRDKLASSAPARVVIVSSKSHYRARGIDFEAVRQSTRSVTGVPEYEVSKLANVLFSAELGRRMRDQGVHTYALHPGVVASDAWRRLPWPVRPLIKRFMLSTEQGAETTLHCASSPAAGEQTGLYYDRSQPREPSPLAGDRTLATELWERSEVWTAAT